MRRIWFKPDCVRWIVEGKKTTIFRTKRHDGIYQIVKGSWFSPVSLGITLKLTPIAQVSLGELLRDYYATEGDFSKPTDLMDWLKQMKLFNKLPDRGWLHRIEVLA